MIISIINATIKNIPYAEPVDIFRHYADIQYSSILTGKGPRDISHYSYIGFSPHTIIRFNGETFEIETEEEIKTIREEFWSFLKRLYRSLDYRSLPFPANRCGFIGYLTYDCYHTIETIASQTEENYSMPLIEGAIYNRYIVFDHHEEKAFDISIDYNTASSIGGDFNRNPRGTGAADLTAECGRDDYIAKVNRIKEYILDGDVYEVCLSQQFAAEFTGSPFQLFEKIFSKNPAPFSAYLNNGDTAVICNSPELFLRCEGSRIETRPIKGTAPRGKSAEEDTVNRERLLQSEKDQAELFMIIDLLRNDIGKVCKTGSVRVIEKKKIEAYENVYQLIGIVGGELDNESDYIDLLKATFPGGSITGCPKIRSMEIIEELELYKRNIYTGTIFIMNSEFLTSNIVIRTAIQKDGRIFINSGGAVTIDSDPEDEYREILHKIKNILKGMDLDDLIS